MANQNLVAGDVAARGQLVANTSDVITFVDDLNAVEIAADGSADLYVTLDNSDPVSTNNKAVRVPAAGSWNSVVLEVSTPGATKVTLKSAGTPKYEVTVA